MRICRAKVVEVVGSVWWAVAGLLLARAGLLPVVQPAMTTATELLAAAM